MKTLIELFFNKFLIPVFSLSKHFISIPNFIVCLYKVWYLFLTTDNISSFSRISSLFWKFFLQCESWHWQDFITRLILLITILWSTGRLYRSWTSPEFPFLVPRFLLFFFQRYFMNILITERANHHTFLIWSTLNDFRNIFYSSPSAMYEMEFPR